MSQVSVLPNPLGYQLLLAPPTQLPLAGHPPFSGEFPAFSPAFLSVSPSDSGPEKGPCISHDAIGKDASFSS